MSKLVDYVLGHTERGSCECGKCLIKGRDQLTGVHDVDMVFFKLRIVNNPAAEELEPLVKAHKGVFGDSDLFDGKEHNYMELGGWIGDQGLALMLMGLGSVLRLWQLLTPKIVLPGLEDALVMELAGRGMVAIQAKKEE